MKNDLQSALKKTRWAQTCIDFLVIAFIALAVAYTIAWNANADRQRKAQRVPNVVKEKPQRADASNLQMASWQAQFDEEEAMWTALGKWLSEAAKPEGQCNIAVNPVGFGSGIAVHCIGVKSSPSKAAEPINFERIKVIAVHPLRKTPKNEKEDVNQHTAAEPIKQQGWVETRQGRRYFDPVNQRWRP